MVSRRALIAGGAGAASAALLASLGYRAWDRGAFWSGKGAAFAPWREWQGHAGEGARRPLHGAILAANAHNSQPWLFAMSEDSIAVYADRARNLGSFDPFRREMHISLGCAIANLQLAALKLGLAARCVPSDGRLQPSPTSAPVEVAEIALRPLTDGDFPSPDELRLAEAIPNRHTNRGPYRTGQTIPLAMLDTLSAAYGSDPARIVLVEDKGVRKELGAIIVEATGKIVADKAMAKDSARWFRTGRREILQHRDGVTTDAAGLSPAMTAVSKLLPDLAADEADQYWLAATRDVQVPTAAVFGLVLVKDRLDMAQALAAGQAWQRFHLDMTARGMAAQPMNEPVEMVDRNAVLGVPDVYARALAELAGLPDMEATMLFRLGTAERPAALSPRRSLDEVIDTTGYA